MFALNRYLSSIHRGTSIAITLAGCATGPSTREGTSVLDDRAAATGYYDLSQATVRVQLGGQACTEIVGFKTPQAVTTFKQGNFGFDAQATAVAAFITDEVGLMCEASIGGRRFSYPSK